MKILPEPLHFQWDKGNKDKNYEKHGVQNNEIEETFYDKNKKLFRDTVHSIQEERYRILGKTKLDRLLFVVFTIRDQKVRVISARDLNKKEVHLYEKTT